jgi:hypothetical protein
MASAMMAHVPCMLGALDRTFRAHGLQGPRQAISRRLVIDCPFQSGRSCNQSASHRALWALHGGRHDPWHRLQLQTTPYRQGDLSRFKSIRADHRVSGAYGDEGGLLAAGAPHGVKICWPLPRRGDGWLRSCRWAPSPSHFPGGPDWGRLTLQNWGVASRILTC